MNSSRVKAAWTLYKLVYVDKRIKGDESAQIKHAFYYSMLQTINLIKMFPPEMLVAIEPEVMADLDEYFQKHELPMQD